MMKGPSDRHQELAIKELSMEARKIRLEKLEEMRKNVGSIREGRIIPEHSPVGESQANGAVESMIERLERKI